MMVWYTEMLRVFLHTPTNRTRAIVSKQCGTGQFFLVLQDITSKSREKC